MPFPFRNGRCADYKSGTAAIACAASSNAKGGFESVENITQPKNRFSEFTRLNSHPNPCKDVGVMMALSGQWLVQLKMIIIMALSLLSKVELSLLAVTETDVDLLNFSTTQEKLIFELIDAF